MKNVVDLDAGCHVIGNSKTPILVIDQPVESSANLIHFASITNWFHADTMYPGIRGTVPTNYFWPLYDSLCSLIHTTFGLPKSQPEQVFCCFSLATQKAEQLKPIQSVPHFDDTSGKQLAMLHYLCDETFDGTGFFRHTETGFEHVFTENLAQYQASAAKNLLGLTASYANLNTRGYSLIARVPAKKGRLVFYPASLLHSGLTVSDASLSCNPKIGRLTITGFIQFGHKLSW